MSDLETIKEMLDRAGIPYKGDRVEETAATGHSAALPDGSQFVSIAGQYFIDEPDGEGREQPYPGGYSGFWSELIFDAEGALIAVWAWE